MKSYLFATITILLTVYGQLILKARSLTHSNESSGIHFLALMFLDPWVMSGLIAALLASATWMMAIRYEHISVIYPFMSLTFIIIPLMAVYFFKEHLNVQQVLGMLFIILGISLAAIPTK